jgi:hypothetical protein
MTDLDPAAIKARHRSSGHGAPKCLDCPWDDDRMRSWPCEPYRLADALAKAQGREQALRALHESRPAAQLGKLSEVCWNCYPRPYPCETIRILDSTHDG